MGVVRTVITFGDWHTLQYRAACERNLRFPSHSPPKRSRRGRDHGEMVDYKLRYYRESSSDNDVIIDSVYSN